MTSEQSAFATAALLQSTEAAKQRQLASTTVQDIAARLQEPMQ